MSGEFVELVTTDNQKVLMRKSAVAALEPVSASVRVEGHVKLYVQGFKFLIQGDVKDLMAKLEK